jgi:hypothetical protein
MVIKKSAQESDMATLNPEYQIYITRYNVMYHDYKMPEPEIQAMLGQEPAKWIEQKAIQEKANEQARIRNR